MKKRIFYPLTKSEKHLLSALLALTNMGVSIGVNKGNLCEVHGRIHFSRPICSKGKLTYDVIKWYWCELAGDSIVGNPSKGFDAEARMFEKQLKDGCPDCWKEDYDVMIQMKGDIK